MPDTERRSKTEEESSNPIVGDILDGGREKRDPPTIVVGAVATGKGGSVVS
jgi:hypothetical protein